MRCSGHFETAHDKLFQIAIQVDLFLLLMLLFEHVEVVAFGHRPAFVDGVEDEVHLVEFDHVHFQILGVQNPQIPQVQMGRLGILGPLVVIGGAVTGFFGCATHRSA